jgi:internalin A
MQFRMGSWAARRSLRVGLFVGSWALALGGCDDPKPKEAEKSAATPAAPPIVPPVPSPEPTRAPEPAKVWPKFSDCQGKEFALTSPELEGAIRVKAQKPEGEITTADLKKLRSLNLSRVPAESFDICVLRFTTALKELAFGAGQLGDLEAVSGLKQLESLSVGKSEVSDLTPIAKLTRLDRLTITDGKVTDLSPLKGLKALTEINLDGNPVVDVSVLSGMKKLEKVSLAKTQVASADAFRELKELKVLYLKGSPLGDEISATGFLVRNGTKVIRD